MRALFVRHGESTGNAGSPCHDLAKLELTEKGREQARQIADEWTEAPALIVVSPYLRAQQTAQPTRDRFSAVPYNSGPSRNSHTWNPAGERNRQKRTAPSHRGLLNTATDLLRRTRRGEFRLPARSCGNCLGQVAQFARPGRHGGPLQSRTVYAGRQNVRALPRSFEPGQDAQLLARLWTASFSERRAVQYGVAGKRLGDPASSRNGKNSELIPRTTTRKTCLSMV